MDELPDDLTLDVPVQGFSFRGSKDQLLAFFEREIAFYKDNSSLLSQPIVVGGHNIGPTNISGPIRQRLTLIRDDLKNDRTESLQEYVADANQLSIALAAGSIGQEAVRLAGVGKVSAALWTLVIFNHAVLPKNIRDYVAPFVVAATGNPTFRVAVDVRTAQEAAHEAQTAIDSIQDTRRKVEDFLNGRAAVVTNLEALYGKKLALEAPAKYWQRSSRRRNAAWFVWLVLFGVAVFGPIVYLLRDFSEVVSGIRAVASESGGGISVAGLAAITIPAGLYAWFLRVLSRMLFQNLVAADDAAHRRALTLTYLGLAENKNLEISESERALILNALFRPAQPHSGDDGPPSGILELLKGRSP